VVVFAPAGYELDLSNGVVHIRPVILRDDPGNILNVRVPSFEVRDEYVNMASRRLELLAHSIVVPPDPAEASLGSGGSMATGSGDRKTSFRLQNATVRDILDKLCLAADLHVWIVGYPPESPTRTAAGFVRTTTVILDLTVDDKFQPVWIFPEWGRSLDR
jgi:hypothetical protein